MDGLWFVSCLVELVVGSLDGCLFIWMFCCLVGWFGGCLEVLLNGWLVGLLFYDFVVGCLDV